MPNTIHIPTPLRPFTDKLESVEVSGATVGELLADLTTRYDGLKKHLYADDGRLRNFVNVYLNDEDIRYLQREKTPVKPGDSLSIVPSVAGGAPTAVETELPTLSQDEIKRYSRHLIMPEVGMDGQRKLKARASCASARAASGRPPRCIWPPPASAASASSTSTSSTSATCSGSCCTARRTSAAPSSRRRKDRLNALNPHVQIDTYETALTSENALELFAPTT